MELKKMRRSKNLREQGVDLQVPSDDHAAVSDIRRTTIVLPRALDANLEIYAGQLGVPKGEIIKQALIEFLRKKGLDPERMPRIVRVVYE